MRKKTTQKGISSLVIDTDEPLASYKKACYDIGIKKKRINVSELASTIQALTQGKASYMVIACIKAFFLTITINRSGCINRLSILGTL